MKAIIVDDEPAIRNTISALLREGFPDVVVIALAGTVAEGYAAVMEHQPDLLFLDVELPDGLGFDLLKKMSSVQFRTIFITGHQEYALD
ncbi:MAG: LytR/AlgR family response regulator transcription factor, partial [Bacteroidales bacterium]